MKIEAFIIAFNEAETIHLTIKHYQKFCDRITIFDNFSTDRTRDIALQLGCDVRLFGIEGVLSDQEYLNVKNHCWKRSDADWVIVCDADEILVTDRNELATIDGTIIRTSGWNIFSEKVPRETWLEIQTGVPDSNYSKSIIFNPKKLIEIGYVYGCHQAKPTGNVVYSQREIPLFHYKHIGGADRLVKRHALYESRRSEHNRKWKLGHQYGEPPEKTRDYFKEMLLQSCEYSEYLQRGT